MANANEVYIKIKAKDGTAQGIGSAERRLGGLSNQAAKLGAAFAGAFAVRAIVRFGTEATNLYNIQAQAEQQLLVALKGREDIQQRLIKQAGDLQRKTLFGDEETIKAQALIAAFVKEEDSIKRVIPLVQDLATAKNMSLASSADLVSKTLGSSTNALARYGIEVKGAVGSVERLESLMGSLNEAFGGQAAAAVKVGTGAVTQMKNEWGDLEEKIGKAIVESDSFRDSISKTSQLMFVLGSDSATTLEKWAMALELSDKRAERIYNQVKKRGEEFEKTQAAAAAAIDAFNKSISEPPPPPDVEPIINVRQRIKELNLEVKDLAKTFKDPGVGFVAADEAFKKAKKLKAEIAALQQIIDYGTVHPTADVPEKIKSREAAPITDVTAPAIVGNADDMQAALDSAKEKMRTMYEELQAEVDTLNEQFNNALVDGLVGGLEAAIGGASFGGVMKAFLTPIAQLMEQQGKLMLVSGLGLTVLKEAFTNPITGGPALIAAGALLIGAAQGIKALGNAGGGGGGGGGYSAATASPGSGTYRPSRRGDNQSIDISGEFEISGDKLVYVLDQAAQNNERTRI